MKVQLKFLVKSGDGEREKPQFWRSEGAAFSLKVCLLFKSSVLGGEERERCHVR